MRAAARDDDRVRHEIEMPLDQIAPDRRKAGQRPERRSIHALRAAAPEIGEELRPGVLAGAEEDRVGVRGRLVRQRRHVQSAKRDVRAPPPVVIGDAIGAVRRRDVDLNHDEVRRVVQVERLDVLVLNLHVVVIVRDTPASVARPSGGNSEYLIGRQNGLVASVSAGRIILTFIARPPRRRAPRSRARAGRPAPRGTPAAIARAAAGRRPR